MNRKEQIQQLIRQGQFNSTVIANTIGANITYVKRLMKDIDEDHFREGFGKVVDCQFKIGDQVKIPKNLYNETTGIVVKIEKKYWTGDRYNPPYNALCLETMNSDIPREIRTINGKEYFWVGQHKELQWCCSKNGFVEVMAKERLIPFYGYSVTVKSEKLRTVFMDESLTKK